MLVGIVIELSLPGRRGGPKDRPWWGAGGGEVRG